MEESNQRENRSHYKIDGHPKKSFAKESDAVMACYKLNTNPFTIHQYVHYKCAVCGMFHIGKTRRELTPEMREKYRKAMKKAKMMQ